MAGQVAPLPAAVVALPYLIHRLGPDRFGILVLAWILIGYFSLFDLGVGRALTQVVARHLGGGTAEDLGTTVWTAMALMAVLGVVAALATVLIAPPMVASVLRVPTRLHVEARSTFGVLAVGIPIVILSTGLRGVLEGHQDFASVNLVRFPLGLATYLGPAVVALFANDLVPVVESLVVSRLLALVAYGFLIGRIMPTLYRRIKVNSSAIAPLLRLGGWMTVSNILSPLLSYADRFLIGAQLSLAAVSYYSTPNELVAKYLILPSALVGVLFPAFASTQVKNPALAGTVFDRAVRFLFLGFYPLAAFTLLFSRPLLGLWLGESFAAHSFVVLEWLALGVLLNGLAMIPFALIHGVGRPDITARLHLAEVPLYLGVLLVLVRWKGIEGAAIAWALRAGVDMVALFLMAARVVNSRYLMRPQLASTLALLVLLLAVAIPTSGSAARFGVGLMILSAYGAATIRILSSPEERSAAVAGLGAISLPRWT